MLPMGCFSLGGRGGSFSRIPQRINEEREKRSSTERFFSDNSRYKSGILLLITLLPAGTQCGRTFVFRISKKGS